MQQNTNTSTDTIDHLANPQKVIFSTKEVAEILDVAPQTIRAHVRSGVLISGGLFGGGHIFYRDEVERFISQRRPSGRPPWLIQTFCDANNLKGQLRKDFIYFVQSRQDNLVQPGKRTRLTSIKLASYYREFMDTYVVITPPTQADRAGKGVNSVKI